MSQRHMSFVPRASLGCHIVNFNSGRTVVYVAKDFTSVPNKLVTGVKQQCESQKLTLLSYQHFLNLATANLTHLVAG